MTIEKMIGKDSVLLDLEVKNKKQLLEVPSQEISISIRHINVDQLLDVLYSKKSKEEIETEILSILEQITA